MSDTSETSNASETTPEESGGASAGEASLSAKAVWRRRGGAFWREWLKPLAIIGLVMFSFRSAVADWNDVPTGSMKPTILEGDRIFINKVAYDLKVPFTTVRIAQWDDPKWGDVVVLRSPEDGKRLVKRVVGLPGDIIEVRDLFLYRNGQRAAYSQLDPSIVNSIEPEIGRDILLAEEIDGREHPIMTKPTPYRAEAPEGPFEVPPGHFFMMGDNRGNSRDSRFFGTVHRDMILGQATAVALSFDPEAYFWPRWERFFSRLP
ncbi:MAG: signal peptidase I [Acidobacteriota bacterium]